MNTCMQHTLCNSCIVSNKVRNLSLIYDTLESYTNGYLLTQSYTTYQGQKVNEKDPCLAL